MAFGRMGRSPSLMGAVGARTPRALDVIDNVYAAFGYERLVSSYPLTSPLVRLRRGSDSAEADFSPDSGNRVTSAAIVAWAGAGVSVFRKTFYDQTGNSRHATQATTAKQPTVHLIGKPKDIFASASSQAVPITNIGGFARNIGAVSIIAIRKYTTYAADQNVVSVSNNSTSARCVIQYDNASGTFRVGGRRLDADSFASITGLAKNKAWAVEIGRWDYTNSDLYHQLGSASEVNNSFQTSGSTSDTDSASATIGAQPNAGGTYFNGLLAGVVLVRDFLTDAEVQTLRSSLLYTGWTQPNYTPWNGPIVAQSATPSSSFIGDPNLVRESSTGHLFAAHCFFNAADTGSTGALYKSTDQGVTWSQVKTFTNLQWYTLWEHTDGNLYIFGMTRAYGDVQIGKSTDHGANWTFATLSTTGGPLAAAGSGTNIPNYHRGSGSPPCYLGGYMFFGLENCDPFTRSSSSDAGFKAICLSVADNVDLMDKANWSASSQLAIGAHSFNASSGMIESNMASDDTGALWQVLRFNNSGTPNKAVFLPLGRSGGTITMPSWDAAYIRDFPGGNIKFQLVRSGAYFYTLANENTAVARSVGSSNDQGQRNRVVLVRGSTTNLATSTFTAVKTVISEDDVASLAEVSLATSVVDHGFQYASILIENGNILPLYRVGWNGADSNGFTNILAYGAPIPI